MTIMGTHIVYLHVCHRKLWLFANEIRMEHTSDVVSEGKWIGETTYTQRSQQFQELEIGGSKIDFYDARRKIVHEVKKSDKAEQAHRAQVKYYLWLLEREGIIGATGILEYPKQRKTEQVELTDDDRLRIPQWIAEIERIISSNQCPPTINKPVCKRCSYYEFCYVGQE